MSTTTSSDRIEKQILLKAPRARVWRALTDAEEFGSWFGAKFDGSFLAGRPTKGRITHPGYDHLKMELAIERMDTERRFSFRWHPGAIDPKADYSNEPTTLVEFLVDETPTGTLLKVVESGFDRLPAGRRDEAYQLNNGGWDEQMKNIERHVANGR